MPSPTSMPPHIPHHPLLAKHPALQALKDSDHANASDYTAVSHSTLLCLSSSKLPTQLTSTDPLYTDKASPTLTIFNPALPAYC